MEEKLTDDEIKALKSMAHYWREVRSRPAIGFSRNILNDEAKDIAGRLGYKLLLIIEDWLRQQN